MVAIGGKNTRIERRQLLYMALRLPWWGHGLMTVIYVCKRSTIAVNPVLNIFLREPSAEGIQKATPSTCTLEKAGVPRKP